MFDNMETLKLVFTGEKGAGTNTIVSEFIESLNESFEPNYKDNYGSLIIKVDGKKVKLSIFCGSLNKDFENVIIFLKILLLSSWFIVKL